MIIMLNIVILILLAIIAVQDIRYRAISWVVIPVLYLLCLLLGIRENGFQYVLDYSLRNLLFIILQLLIVSLYFIFRHRKLIKITGMYLGWGDILFIAAITPLFPTNIYILYMVTGMFLVLSGHWVWSRITGKNKIRDYIPLAGLLAIYLTIIRINYLLFPHFITRVMSTLSMNNL